MRLCSYIMVLNVCLYGIGGVAGILIIEREESPTSVVFPAPCTPFRPRKKGGASLPSA